MHLRLPCLALLLAPSARAQDTTALRVNQPVTREIAQNERQTYSLTRGANQFVVGEADQHDLDLVVPVDDPDGGQMHAFDDPARGPEPFIFTATQAGRITSCSTRSRTTDPAVTRSGSTQSKRSRGRLRDRWISWQFARGHSNREETA